MGESFHGVSGLMGDNGIDVAEAEEALGETKGDSWGSDTF